MSDQTRGGKCPYEHAIITEEAEAIPEVVLATEPEALPEPPSIQENVPTFEALRGIFDPLAKLAAARMSVEHAVSAPADAERMASIHTYSIPYRAEFLIMPPNLFGSAEPVMPQTDDERNALMDAFAKAMRQDGTPAERRYWAAPTDPRRSDPIHSWGAVGDNMMIWGRYGVLDGFNQADWKRYAAIYADHLSRGDEADFLELFEYRKREVTRHWRPYDEPKEGKHEADFPSRFERFLFGTARLNDPEWFDMPSAIVVPVGEYGEEFADQLLRAGVLAIEKLDYIVDDEARAAAEGNEYLLWRHTARSRTEYLENGQVTKLGVKGSLQEGTLSDIQALVQLTARKVEGYDDPAALVRDIIDQGILERYTRKVTMGTVGPLTLTGNFFDHPLRVVGGRLELSPDLVALLDKKKAKSTYVARRWIDFVRGYPPDDKDMWQTTTGLICPVAGKDGGVSHIASRIADYLEMQAEPAAS